MGNDLMTDELTARMHDDHKRCPSSGASCCISKPYVSISDIISIDSSFVCSQQAFPHLDFYFIHRKGGDGR